MAIELTYKPQIQRPNPATHYRTVHHKTSDLAEDLLGRILAAFPTICRPELHIWSQGVAPPEYVWDTTVFVFTATFCKTCVIWSLKSNVRNGATEAFLKNDWQHVTPFVYGELPLDVCYALSWLQHLECKT